MKRLSLFLLLLIFMSGNSYAATWLKLRGNGNSKLTIDKQSIIEKDQLKRAWVKIEYKMPQKSLQAADKDYNLSKLLWYFDCPAQKAATSQVFQYLNDELIYSASIEAKNAEFIEPVPETDLDIAMRHVCMKPAAKPTTPVSKPADASNKPEAQKETPATAEKPAATPAKPEAPAETKPEAKSETKPGTKPEVKPAANSEKSNVKNTADKNHSSKKEDAHKIHWTYEGKEGPENWAKLNPDFATCEAGRNQSPINIENAMQASLKPLKLIHRYAAGEIINNGHTVQVSFKEGNMVILDNTAFYMKQVHFHAPSENQMNGKSYPMEAHFVHMDSKGNLAVMAIMIKEGKANPALESFWQQLSSEQDKPVAIKGRVLPSELMPANRSYYRFSGSLTTPPCSEGVRWLVLKTPITASKEQIAIFEEALKHHNNRPIQPLNGRIVVE